MSNPLYTTRGRVEKVRGVHRRGHLETGHTMEMGVHGPIKAHYRIDAEDLPLPVDYMVIATGGGMLGTLNGVLEAREVSLDPDDIAARVEGHTRLRDGLPVLTEIVVHYTLRVPPEARETVERALERHASKCPSARTLEGAVEVRWTAEIRERPGS